MFRIHVTRVRYGLPRSRCDSEWIAIQIALYLDANFDNAIFFGLRNTQQNITCHRLAFIQCSAFGLADTARNQPCGTSNTATITASNRGSETLALADVINGLILTHFENGIAPIGDANLVNGRACHSDLLAVWATPPK